jgi:SAM-dependent methyltransferase
MEMIAPDTFWDNVADKYAKSPIKDEASYEKTLDRVRAHLKPTDRVLELGCGTGTTALKLADAAQEIVATDIAPRMIRVGETKADKAGVKNVRFMTAVPGDPQLVAEGPFDVVMAFNLLHLLEDLPAAMAQIAQHVRPGGLFISKTFCRPDWGQGNLEYYMTRLALPVMQTLGKAPFVGFMEIEELERHISHAGFTLVETGNYPERPPRRFIVGKKPEV